MNIFLKNLMSPHTKRGISPSAGSAFSRTFPRYGVGARRYFLYIFLLIFVVGFLVGRFSTFDKINSIFSNLNPVKFAQQLFNRVNSFRAAISPESFEDGSEIDFSEINIENLLPEEEPVPVVEELTEKEELEGELSGVGQVGQLAEPNSQLTLEEIQEMLDDIAEQIDVINQEVAELMGEIQETTEKEAVAEEEVIVEEELEDEEEKESICPDGIDINTAPKEELEKIAGVGPVIAQKIIDARPFYSFNDLLRVSGIGEKTLQGIIEQGCAYIEDDMGSDSSGLISAPGGGGGTSPSQQTKPKITLSYSENNPVNKEIEVALSLADLKNVLYDVKISIEKEGVVLSEIYNQKEAEWKSSLYYLKEVFSGSSFNGNLKLRIKNDKRDFRGEADIFAKIRKSGKTTIYAEFGGKINITEPEFEPEPESGPGPEPEPEPEPEPDTTPPQIVFNLEPIQTSLSFTISFEIIDKALETTTPPGLDGFIFRWKEKEGGWQEDSYYQIEDALVVYPGQKEFTGEDEKTYYFQIKAKDLVGNESDWIEVLAKISLPKIVLINEIQIDSIVGKGGVDDDWVELYNPNDVDVSLASWSIQEHSKSDPCSVLSGFYQKSFPDDAIIPTKGFYLIVDTDANDSLKNIADMTIGWLLTDDNTVYLVRNQDKIESGDDPDIIDKVGFGLACFAETEPFLNPPEAKSIKRKELGLDTNDNSQDFKINDTPTPTNSKGETILQS